MEDIYQRVSGGCWRSNNTSELKPEQIGGKKKISHQDDYKESTFKWLTSQQGFLLCDLLLQRLRPFLVCVLSIGGNEHV